MKNMYKSLMILTSCAVLAGAASNKGAWNKSSTYSGDYLLNVGDTVSYGMFNGKTNWWWSKFYSDSSSVPGEFAASGGYNPWVLVNSKSASANSGKVNYQWHGWNGEYQNLTGLNAKIPTWRDGAVGAYTMIHDQMGMMDYTKSIKPAVDLAASYPEIKQTWAAVTSSMDGTEWAKAKEMVLNGHEIACNSMNYSPAGEQWRWFLPGSRISTNDPLIPEEIRGLTVVGTWGTMITSAEAAALPVKSPNLYGQITLSSALVDIKCTEYTSRNAPSDKPVGTVLGTDYAGNSITVISPVVTPKSGVSTVTLSSGQKVYVKYTKRDLSGQGLNEGSIAAVDVQWFEIYDLQRNGANGWQTPSDLVKADKGAPGFIAKIRCSNAWNSTQTQENISSACTAINSSVYSSVVTAGEYFRKGKQTEFYSYPYDSYSENTHGSLEAGGFVGACGGNRSGQPIPGDFYHPYRINYDAFFITASDWTVSKSDAIYIYPENPHMFLGMNQLVDKAIESKGYMVRKLHSVADIADGAWYNAEAFEFWPVNDSADGVGGWWGGITKNQLKAHYDYLKSKIASNELTVYTASEAVKYRMTTNAVSSVAISESGGKYTLAPTVSEMILDKYRDEISVIISLNTAVASSRIIDAGESKKHGNFQVHYNTVDANWGQSPRRKPRMMDTAGKIWSISLNPYLGPVTIDPNSNWDGQGIESTTPANSAPTNITLSASSISVGATAVGTLTTTDPNTSDTHTYAVVTGSDKFEIIGSTLNLKAGVTAGTYTVRIKTTDGGGLAFEKDFSITVSDFSEVIGNNQWIVDTDELKTGSQGTVTGTQPVTISLTKGSDVGENYAFVSADAYVGSMASVTAIEITYTSDKNISLTLYKDGSNSYGYSATLVKGISITKRLIPSDFALDWSTTGTPKLTLSEISNISFMSQIQGTTNISVTSLKLYGYVKPADTQKPVISNMPSNISVTISASKSDTVITWSAPTATDNSGISPTLTCSPASGSSFPVGTTTVTYTAKDGSNNEITASFTVTVSKAGTGTTDTEKPVISITSPTAGSSFSTNTPVTIQWSASDNVGVTGVILEYTGDNGINWNEITTVTDGSSKYSWTPSAAGSYKIRATAFDAVSHISDYAFCGPFSITVPTVKQFTITVTPNDSTKAVITPQTAKVDSLKAQTFSISAKAGNRIDSLKVNARKVTLPLTNNQLTISNVTGDSSVTAWFSAVPAGKKTFIAVVNAVSTSSGTITPSNGSVDSGTVQIFTIKPQSGSRLDSAKINGSKVNVVNDTVSYKVISNSTVEAWFSLAGTGTGNKIPTDITLNNSSVYEKKPAGTFVGKLTTADEDLSDTHTYELVSGTTAFEIRHDSLVTKREFVRASGDTEFSPEIKTSDSKGGSFTKLFKITVKELNLTKPDTTVVKDSTHSKSAADTLKEVIGKVVTAGNDTVRTINVKQVIVDSIKVKIDTLINGDPYKTAYDQIIEYDTIYLKTVLDTIKFAGGTLPADFNGDKVLDIKDFAKVSDFWYLYANKQTAGFIELAPDTGTLESPKIVPDGKFDFKDLSRFVQYCWKYQTAAPAVRSRSSEKLGVAGTAVKKDGIVYVSISAESLSNVTAVSCRFTRNDESAKWQEGSFISGGAESLAMRGTAGISIARLSEKGTSVSGSGVIALAEIPASMPAECEIVLVESTGAVRSGVISIPVTEERSSAVKFSCAPNPFTAGEPIRMTVSSESDPLVSAELRVYDAAGNMVNRQVQNSAGSDSVNFVWDGMFCSGAFKAVVLYGAKSGKSGTLTEMIGVKRE